VENGKKSDTMRYIVHLNIPDFGAALEERRRGELKKRPLVLAEPGPRAVVQGVNGIARREGVHEGMSLGQARRICRRILTIPPDLRLYGEEHRHIVEDLGRFSPLVEGTLPGRYFIDLTGTERLWGFGPDAACRMERDLTEKKGLHARIGIASNKLISQVAADCVPPGDLSCIFQGAETSFLAPLPVTHLPGVGAKTAVRLSDFNIQQIGQLAALSAEAISGVFGNTGLRLLKIARGIDPAPVLPFRKVPRLAAVHNLRRDEIDRERLEAILFRLVEEGGWNLRCSNRYPGRFALEIRHADGMTVRLQNRMPPESANVDWWLFRAIYPVFLKLLRRRVAVRRIAVEFSEFSMPFRQIPLFPWENIASQDDRELQSALDGIRQRFGRHIISWGRASIDGPARSPEDESS